MLWLNFTLNWKTAAEVYQDVKNLYGDDWLVLKSADGLCIFKKAGNRWRMIIVQASQFLLGPIEMWR